MVERGGAGLQRTLEREILGQTLARNEVKERNGGRERSRASVRAEGEIRAASMVCGGKPLKGGSVADEAFPKVRRHLVAGPALSGQAGRVRGRERVRGSREKRTEVETRDAPPRRPNEGRREAMGQGRPGIENGRQEGRGN